MIRPADQRTYAILLMAACLGVVFFMAHHPTSPHQTGGIAGLVHGAMLVMVALLLVGFTGWSLHRGLQQPMVLAALISYLLSVFCNFGAATINGFVVPTLAARDPEPGPDVFLLAWEGNQALALLGVVATGVAYVLWSINLFARGGAGDRIVAAVGVLVGALPAVLLLSGRFAMDVSTAFAIYGAHGAWAAALGVLLWRERDSAR